MLYIYIYIHIVLSTLITDIYVYVYMQSIYVNGTKEHAVFSWQQRLRERPTMLPCTAIAHLCNPGPGFSVVVLRTLVSAAACYCRCVLSVLEYLLHEDE